MYIDKYGLHATDNAWLVKESTVMPKTGSLLLSLSVMDRDQEVMTIPVPSLKQSDIYHENCPGSCGTFYSTEGDWSVR